MKVSAEIFSGAVDQKRAGVFTVLFERDCQTIGVFSKSASGLVE